MAVSMIKNQSIKSKSFTFTNLTQYNPSGYYLRISGIKAKAGLPENGKLINASLSGWSGLGTSPSVELADEDAVFLFFASGTTITSSSYANIRFVYS